MSSPVLPFSKTLNQYAIPKQNSLESLLETHSFSYEEISSQFIWEMTVQSANQDKTLCLQPQNKVNITSPLVARAIGEFFQQAGCVNISLKNCQFNDEAWKELLKSFYSSSVESVAFDTCALSSLQIKCLLALTDKKSVQKIAINHQKLVFDRDMMLLLSRNKFLKELNFDFTELNDADISSLKKALNANPMSTLEVLHLNNNQIELTGASLLVDLAYQKASLKELHLDNNKILGEFSSVFNMILKNKPKFILSLNGNEITCEMVAESLKEWSLSEETAHSLQSFTDEGDACCYPAVEKSSKELLTAFNNTFIRFEQLLKQASEPVQELIDIISSFPQIKLKEFLFSKVIDKFFQKQSVASDGNCLFSSLVFLLNLNHSHKLDFVLSHALRNEKKYFATRDYRSTSQAMLLRYAAVEYINKHPDKFGEFIEREEHETIEEAVKKYTNKMVLKGTWGGNIELIAISELFHELGEPLPFLKILDPTKLPSIVNGEFTVPNWLNVQQEDTHLEKDSSDLDIYQNPTPRPPYLYLLRQNQNHFMPLIKRELNPQREEMEIDEHPLLNEDPFQEMKSKEKLRQHFITATLDNQNSLSAIIRLLENQFSLQLHFVVSGYLNEHAADFTKEISRYKEMSQSELLKRIIVHYQNHYANDVFDNQLDNDLLSFVQIFKRMDEPLNIRLIDTNKNDDLILKSSDYKEDGSNELTINLLKIDGKFEAFLGNLDDTKTKPTAV